MLNDIKCAAKNPNKTRLAIIGLVLAAHSMPLMAGDAFANIANTLGIIPQSSHPHNTTNNHQNLFTQQQTDDFSLASNKLEKRLLKILTDHLSVSNSPYYLTEDLMDMAAYYAQFPHVVELFNSIADYPWTLEYQKNRWSTQLRGTPLSVQSAIIRFDTRAAAQFMLRPQCRQNPQCIASPADALLHELLHVQAAFLDTKRFIVNGGMNRLSYPMLHEMEIINQEKLMYKAMQKLDGKQRPLRTKHIGKISRASCVTCIM